MGFSLIYFNGLELKLVDIKDCFYNKKNSILLIKTPLYSNHRKMGKFGKMITCCVAKPNSLKSKKKKNEKSELKVSTKMTKKKSSVCNNEHVIENEFTESDNTLAEITEIENVEMTKIPYENEAECVEINIVECQAFLEQDLDVDQDNTRSISHEDLLSTNQENASINRLSLRNYKDRFISPKHTKGVELNFDDISDTIELLKVKVSVTIYTSLTSYINKCTCEWKEEFLEREAFKIMLDTLTASVSSHFGFKDAILQLCVVQCIKSLLNCVIGLNYLTEKNSELMQEFVLCK